MKAIKPNDREIIIGILADSFDDNKSVRYLSGSGKDYRKRIKSLIKYCLQHAQYFGKVYLTENKEGCALVIFPHKTKTTLRTILWDLKLIFTCIGVINIGKAMKRENYIKKLHPDRPFYYLWYIGVNPKDQNKGIGTALLQKIIKDAKAENCPIYLETSTEKNLPWYQENGFSQFSTSLYFDYHLYPLSLTQ